MVLKVVGSGGMGVVCAAYDPELDRRVALKFLHHRPDRHPETFAQKRLVREARALARLSHPNVLPVYDVGHFGDQVYLAMEFVEGRNLAEWQKTKNPSWQEILIQYIAAGKGLAAAHKAGLVHRDFKPQNVLLGKDGRIRVADFGLARAVVEEAEATAGEKISTDDLLASPLTRSGAILGTPAYMAPEQIEGHSADARADQFSFAVALYEAFYSERPFAGTNPQELSKQIRNGEIQPAPPGSSVPMWLRRVLLRALNHNPERRFVSMRGLIRALERDPAKVRRKWIGGFGSVAVVALAGTLLYNQQQERSKLCSRASEHLAGVWDAPRRAELQSAFAGTGLAYAADTWKTVSNLIDGFADSWVAGHTQACEATHFSGEQSSQLLDLRMTCYESRRQELKALGEIFLQLDEATLSNAVKAAGALSNLEACGDASALLAQVPPPTDPTAQRAIESIQEGLARARALRVAGRYELSIEQARRLLSDAGTLDYAPLIGDIHQVLGDALEAAGEIEEAGVHLELALELGIAGRDDRLAAGAAASLIWVDGYLGADTAAAERWARQGKAFLVRLGGDPRLEAEILSTEGTVLQDQGRYEEALSRAERVVDLRRTAFGERHERFAVALVNLANAKRFSESESSDEISRLYESARVIFLELYGNHHPALVTLLYNIGGGLDEAGEHAKARQILLEALDLAEGSLGHEHAQTGIVYINLGDATLHLGEPDQAIEYFREGLDILESSLGESHPYLGFALLGVGESMLGLGRAEEALVPLRRGNRLLTEATGHPLLHGKIKLQMARGVLALTGDRRSARALALEARELADTGGEGAVRELARIDGFLESLDALALVRTIPSR